jgi:hypothetical protein
MASRNSEVARGGVVGVSYEGRSVVEFVTGLRLDGVQIVVDARLVPRCNRRGFSRHVLAEALRANGIQYVHYEELGNPDVGQVAFRGAADAAAAADRYRVHLASPRARAVIRDLITVSGSRRVGVMTAELDLGQAQQEVLLGEIERYRPGTEDIDSVLKEFGAEPTPPAPEHDDRDRLEREIDALLAEFG